MHRFAFDPTKLPPKLKAAVDKLTLTILCRDQWTVVVRCPMCERERPVSQASIHTWARDGRVPDCRLTKRRPTTCGKGSNVVAGAVVPAAASAT